MQTFKSSSGRLVSKSHSKGDAGEAIIWAMLKIKEPFAMIIKIDKGADFLVIRERPCDWYFVDAKTGPSARSRDYQLIVQRKVGPVHYVVASRMQPQFHYAEQQGQMIIRDYMRWKYFGNPHVSARDALVALDEFGLEIC
jgi:hypothetical protein